MAGTLRGPDLVRRDYEEMWNGWKFSLADDLLDEHFTFRGSLGDTIRGREEFKRYMRTVRTAFSDFTNHIEEMIAVESRIAVRLTYTGTHDGIVLGIVPTGRHITYPGIAMFTTAAGRLDSGYVVGDRLTLLEQILGAGFWR